MKIDSKHALGATLAAATLSFPTLARAAFDEVPLASPRVVSYDFATSDANVLIPSHDGRLRSGVYRGYAPLLNVRRRILANAWVGGLIASGSLQPGLRLSRDTCQENELLTPSTPCTAVPPSNVDHLSLEWLGSTPTDVLFNELNEGVPASDGSGVTRHALHADSMAFGPAEASLTDPGLLLSFVSGPPVSYDQSFRWADMPTPPTGEGTGFDVDQLQLLPTGSGLRGSDLPPVFAQYEQASGILLGGSSDDAEDSVHFTLEPSSNRSTLAIWFPTSDARADVTAYVHCGEEPTHDDFSQSSGGASRPIFFDLRAPCSAGWHVVVASRGRRDTVFHFTVGDHFESRELRSLRVGIEFPTRGPADDDVIRNSVREAAWRFFGVTGGSYMIRSITYTTGACSGVHICWRNDPTRAGCRQGAGLGDPFHGSLHICQLPMRGTENANAELIAHELGHSLVSLGDEYWSSNDFARICGRSGWQIRRCDHSIMGYHFDDRVALCTDETHDRSPEFFIEPSPGAPFRGPFTVLGPSTVTECGNGEVNMAGPWGDSGWAHLLAAGVATRAHPAASPANFDYRVFALSAERQEIGENLD